MAAFTAPFAAQATAISTKLTDTVREARGDGPGTGGKLGPDALQRNALAAQTQFEQFKTDLLAAGAAAFV